MPGAHDVKIKATIADVTVRKPFEILHHTTPKFLRMKRGVVPLFST
jgi:hypothetical protein